MVLPALRDSCPLQLCFYLPSEIHVCCLFVSWVLGRMKIAISQPCAVRRQYTLSPLFFKLAVARWPESEVRLRETPVEISKHLLVEMNRRC
jgi:hypothetical protein